MTTEPTSLFLRACQRLPVDRRPVWIMRQAGRYLPQYRAVREKVSFLELVKSPDLACEVTLQPISEFGFDAAIIFSDILVPLEAMGMELRFTEDGPSLPAPVRDEADVARLRSPDPEETMPFVMEAIRRTRKALDGKVPLIGFAGAPFTLASYAVEGGGSKSFTILKRLLFAAPHAAHELLTRIADTTVATLKAQIAAGAQAVQLFDTWAGILSPRDFAEFAFRYAERVFSQLRGGVPLIYFVNGGGPYLEQMRNVGADVIGIDWKTDIGDARARLGTNLAVQGNLDPACLYLPPAEIARRAEEILRAAGPIGHIFNLGHGIYPDVPVEHVRALIAAVHRYGQG